MEIAKDKIGEDRVWKGQIIAYSGNVFRFLGGRSSGQIVQSSDARFCGVVTGQYNYDNSIGGVTHAVEMVGMFDLPENKVPAPGATLDVNSLPKSPAQVTAKAAPQKAADMGPCCAALRQMQANSPTEPTTMRLSDAVAACQQGSADALRAELAKPGITAPPVCWTFARN